MSKVRTRFAPSPTGYLHVGGLRTALFKYLFAKNQQGTFILRIDDTDRERFVEGSVEHIFDSLRWLGLEWDEGPEVGGDYGPYEQSKRFDIYHEYADKLSATGALYPCWCSAERLDKLRKQAQAEKRAFKYDRYCLTHPKDLAEPHVMRFFIPESPLSIGWDDAVRGHVEVKTTDLDDFIAIKSDGWPTYHFSSIVDDETMKITHVIRGDEWVASTPKHLLLYKAFKWEPPIYAHIPTVLGPDGKHKLSKRDNAKSAIDYKNLGYLPEAVINYLASLGFNDGSEQEIYSRHELAKIFSLERISKSPAVFDERRLDWMNGYWIRQLKLDELSARVQGFWPAEAEKANDDFKKQVLGLVQERLKYFAELPDLTRFFFTDLPLDMKLITENKQLKQLNTEELKDLLERAKTTLTPSDFSVDDLSARLNRLLEETGQKPVILFSLIRIATTSAPASPGLADTLAVLGKQRSLGRVDSWLAAF
ncbi:MAG TPA: glutamate--tRNA ligase [Candidatus Dormibacteraeota bacterium]|nr:glutamate--tRNA ligase [Candidatus Dormibacteraeota bacterium]